MGYIFQGNGRQEGHIKDRVEKAMGIAEQVWNIGKRFEKNIRKNMAVRHLAMDGIRVGCKDLGMERERKSGKNGGKIFKMDVRGRTPGYLKKGVAKG